MIHPDLGISNHPHYRFFNDVFSQGGFGGIWHTLRAFYDGDTYLALPLRSQLVDQAVSVQLF